MKLRKNEETITEQDLITKNQQLQDKIVQLEDRNNKLVDEIAKNTLTDKGLQLYDNAHLKLTHLTNIKVSEKIKNNPESLYTSTFVEVEWLQDATTLQQFVDKFMTSDLYLLLMKKLRQISAIEERIKVITI